MMGVGALIKLVPLLLFPAVVCTRPWRHWGVHGMVVAIVIGAVCLSLLFVLLVVELWRRVRE